MEASTRFVTHSSALSVPQAGLLAQKKASYDEMKPRTKMVIKSYQPDTVHIEKTKCVKASEA